MGRLFIVLALASLLGACSSAGTASSDTSSAPDASMAASESAAASSPAGEGPSAACADAFAPLAEMGLTSITELGDLQDEVEPTIENCESVADWVAGADSILDEDFTAGAADLLLRIRCDDPNMTDAPVCVDLRSS